MFQQPTIDISWSFKECSQKDTSYLTHNYYTYPAKFIPQLASRLILAYSEKGDIVVDTFMGSGTTVIESIVNERIGIGTDINEIAHLVAKVKATPILPTDLQDAFNTLEKTLKQRLGEERQMYVEIALQNFNFHERIDYWFKPTQKEDLS